MPSLWSPETSPSYRNDRERQIGGLIQEAINHVENILTPLRSDATDYYHGRPLGNEEQGRSRVVDTVVRDTVQGMLPSLLRIFLGSERTVEFRPKGPEDEAQARQATDYINYIIREDNDGFLQFNAAFLDSMVRKLGIFKYWWDEQYREAGYQFQGLTAEDVTALQMDKTVSDVKVGKVYRVDESPDSPVLYDVEVTRKYDESRARFAALPPEEFLFTPSARSPEDAILLGHRRELRKSELLAMGYKESDLEEVGAYENSISQNEEAKAREVDDAAMSETESDHFDPKYLYVEAFVREGSSWRKYCTLGSAFQIQNGKDGEAVDQPPFCVLPCVIEPHTIVGQSIADLTMDLQKINSAVLRGTIDSLGNAITPRTAVDEYSVQMADVLNTEVGGVIRTKGPPTNSIMEFKHNFVGADTLPFLQYMNEVRENRTGQTKAAAGLDADALQSSTKAAVAATLTASQQRIEMLARVFAETGIKSLFKGLLKLVVEHPDRVRVIRLRNQYVEVDPKSWDATMDVSVHVGLGVGMPEEKLNILNAIATKQEAILQMLGPVNPLVNISQYSNTLTRMVELAGFANPKEFFSPIDPKQMEQMTAAAGQEKGPSPEQLLAQVQMESIKADVEMKKADLMLKQQQMMMDDDRERDKAAADFALQAAELELKYGTAVDVAKIKANATATRNTQLGGPNE